EFAQIYDEFNFLNSDNWDESTFDGHSLVYVDGGLHLIDRGRITSAESFVFNQPTLLIGGTIHFTNPSDILNVVFRSSGNYDGSFGETSDGLKVYFGPFSGGILGLDEVSSSGEGGTEQLYQAFPGGIGVESTYDFMVLAMGSDIYFSIGP